MDYEQINKNREKVVRELKDVKSINKIPGGQRVFFKVGNIKVSDSYRLDKITRDY